MDFSKTRELTKKEENDPKKEGNQGKSPDDGEKKLLDKVWAAGLRWSQVP